MCISMQGAVLRPQIQPAKYLCGLPSCYSGMQKSSLRSLEAPYMHLHDTVLEQVTIASLPSLLLT